MVVPPPAPAPWARTGLSPRLWSLGQVTEQHKPPWWPFAEGVGCRVGRSVLPLLLSAHNKCFGFALHFQSSEEIQGATTSLEIYLPEGYLRLPIKCPFDTVSPSVPAGSRAGGAELLPGHFCGSSYNAGCFSFSVSRAHPGLLAATSLRTITNSKSAEPSTPALMKRSGVATCNIHYAPSLRPRCRYSTG